MGILWWLISVFGSHGIAFILGIAAIPATIIFLFPEILTILYKELVVKGILFDSPKYESASEIPVPVLDSETKEPREKKDGATQAAAAAATHGRVSGWLVVRRQYKPSKEGILFTNATTDLTGAQKRKETTDSTLTRDSASLKSGHGDGEDDDPKLDADAASTMTTDSSGANSVKSTAASTAAQRSWVQAARQTLTLPKREAPAKERFYCVLKGSVLYLYEDEKQSDALAVLAVDRFKVRIETSAGRFKGRDGEMFAKKNAIVMRLSQGEKGSMPVLARGMTGDGQHQADGDMEKAPWYLMSKNNSELEDWYLALVQASALPPSMEDVFSYEDMQDLVKTIDAEQDPIPTRWLNAILGRVFFGLYRTAFVEEFIIGRIMKKLNKVVKPTWLSDITVQEVNIGTFPPFFSKPMLKDLKSDGSITFEAYLRYVARENQPNSKIRLTMAFLATIPVGFKSIQVPVVAAVIVRAMEGNMIFTIKPAPSNRIWYGFTTEPVMDIEISLMGAEWKVESSFILNQLKKFLKQAIAEVLVAPNFDDLAFFDTSKFNVRGGIFSEAAKMNAKAEREDVTLQKGTPSQPGVVPKEGSEVSKKRTSILGDLGKPGSEDTKKAESVLSKFQTELGHGQHGESEKGSGSGLGRSNSNASNRSRTEVVSKGKLDHSALGNEAASASAPTLVHLEGTDTVTSSPASDRPPTITSGFHPLPKPASIKSNDTSSSTAHTETPGADIDRSASPGTAAHSASLLESFRARDKQAIAAQVSSAKSVVRKWGIDFAAKRRADFQAPAIGTGIKGQQTQPQAIYRPQEDDRLQSTGSTSAGASTSLGHSPNRTLQERLNDAAKAAAIANVTTTTNRERSHSNLSNTSSSSRPTLLASPSKSGAVAGPSISEPTFTLSDQKPRRDSVPVLMQPAAGRGMVVPRVVKRPGEVTGLGNSPGQGLTRKISEDAGPTTSSANKTPDLGPRKSAESDRPGVPPPLPKNPNMSELGVEMQRSGSAPIPSTPSGEITEPNQIVSLTKSDDDIEIEKEKEKESGELVDTSIPQPGPSGAQDALRKLADKNV